MLKSYPLINYFSTVDETVTVPAKLLLCVFNVVCAQCLKKNVFMAIDIVFLCGLL